jgi:DNA-directed RNA polymerase subunit E'/Rpb7
MSGPYINTELYTTISLHSSQMDNKIYLNLKKNLENKVSKKCFRDYGYITEVYEILDYKDGIIEGENFSASAKFDVTFSCRLCLPLRFTQIICKVDRVNKLLITAVNGPILVIITNERINDKIFFTDNNNNLRHKQNEKSFILKPSEYVKVTINKITFNHGDQKIKAIGFLDDIASENDKIRFYQELYNKEGEPINFDDYIKKNNN